MVISANFFTAYEYIPFHFEEIFMVLLFSPQHCPTPFLFNLKLMVFVAGIAFNTMKQALCHFEKHYQIRGEPSENTVHYQNHLAIIRESCFGFTVPI
jgi:hypothetical protein